MDRVCYVDNASFHRKYFRANFSVVIVNFRFCLESSLFVFAPGGSNTKQFVFPVTFGDVSVCFHFAQNFRSPVSSILKE